MYRHTLAVCVRVYSANVQVKVCIFPSLGARQALTRNKQKRALARDLSGPPRAVRTIRLSCCEHRSSQGCVCMEGMVRRIDQTLPCERAGSHHPVSSHMRGMFDLASQ